MNRGCALLLMAGLFVLFAPKWLLGVLCGVTVFVVGGAVIVIAMAVSSDAQTTKEVEETRRLTAETARREIDDLSAYALHRARHYTRR